MKKKLENPICGIPESAGIPLTNPHTVHASKKSEVILNGAAAWAKAAGRCAVKDPVRNRTANQTREHGRDCREVRRVLTGFFGCAMPATFARRASLRLRMTT